MGTLPALVLNTRTASFTAGSFFVIGGAVTLTVVILYSSVDELVDVDNTVDVVDIVDTVDVVDNTDELVDVLVFVK